VPPASSVGACPVMSPPDGLKEMPNIVQDQRSLGGFLALHRRALSATRRYRRCSPVGRYRRYIGRRLGAALWASFTRGLREREDLWFEQKRQL
jgi:hypothetical protein